MRMQLLCVFSLLLAFIGGCAPYPTYNTKATNEREGAVVRGQWAGFKLPPPKPFVGIEKVDGMPRAPYLMPIGPIIVDPGPRILSVVGHVYRGYKGEIGQIDLNADLMAGHSYLVRFEHKEGAMTFWVEDVATQEMIGSKQSTSLLVPEPVGGGGLIFVPMFHF